MGLKNGNSILSSIRALNNNRQTLVVRVNEYEKF